MGFKKVCYNCMKEKPQASGVCPHCGFKNEDYHRANNQLPPLTPLNGKYVLGRALGAGGFGITYVAYDTYLQVVVAIKELFLKKISIREQTSTISVNSKDKMCFEDNKKRFLQEARVLAMFNEKDNEGVVIVKDHFEENNTAYIVMEYLSGDTLKKRVKDNKLSFDEMKELMEPVCHALMKIHQFGVVHLDVSPDNIMLSGEKGAKLLDFGGAKTIGVKEDDVIAFKRGYAPLEQRMENGKVGQWTDVYATAATMYYCLTGVKPTDAMERKAGAELERPSKKGAKIPKVAEDAIMKALELNPADRYQTMEEFWDALSIKKKKNTSGTTSKQSAGNNGGKKGNKGLFIGIGIVAVVAIILIVAVVMGGGKKKNLPPISETETENQTEEGINDDVQVEVGETMPMNLGTYIFENAADRNLIMGIDGGFGDDGTPVVLKNYEDTNKNRVFVTDEIEGDGFYNLRAAHTNSFLETSAFQDLGEVMRQFSEMYDMGTEKWNFVFCGHDEEKDMDEVILINAAGSVLAPKDGNLEAGTQLVLSEFNMDDDSQKWFVRWSEKDESEKDVVVYHEGDMVENLEGTFNVSSALDGMTSWSISRDEAFHPEPAVVVFHAEWLTTEDTVFQFEFVPTGSESRYKIFPIDQAKGEHKCLEYNVDTNELVMRDESNSENQLFRIIYVKSNTYLLQAFNESVVGFDLDADGTAVGKSVLVRPYDAVEDSRLESWVIVLPHAVEE